MPKWDRRQNLTRRLVALIHLAQTRRYMPEIHELAATFGVSDRTIYRDLTVIEEAMPVRWRKYREVA
jgi:predicted DNA-binding transcriptional regulator YafY